MKTLFNGFLESADLIVIPLDCIDIEIASNSKLAKIIRKLSIDTFDRTVLFLLADAEIMFDNETDINEQVLNLKKRVKDIVYEKKDSV